MLLLPDGSGLRSTESASLSLPLIRPDLISADNIFPDHFLHQPGQLSLPVIYAFQGECLRILSRDHRPRSHKRTREILLASGDATTCAIAVLLDRSNGAASICHHDEKTVKMPELIERSVEGMHRPDLYLVGGWMEDEMEGVGEVTKTLLSRLDAMEIEITVRLSCVGRWNRDEEVGRPINQSLAVSVSSGATWVGKTWNWDRGPCLEERRAQTWYGTIACEEIEAEFLPHGSVEIVDGTLVTFEIEFLTGSVGEAARELFAYLARRPDEELLQHLSTSPSCELPHVTEDIRNGLLWHLAQTGAIRKNRQRFVWRDERQRWEIEEKAVVGSDVGHG